MKVPKKVLIGPHTYKVRFEKLNDNHGVLGQTRTVKTEIAIDPEQSQSQIEDTFIHEILHAIQNQNGFINGDKDAEEQAVSRLAPALLQVIKQNKGLFT